MKGFVGYEFEAVIEARKEVRDTALKNKLALKNDIRLAQEEKRETVFYSHFDLGFRYDRNY